MPALREFESKAVRLMADNVLSEEQLTALDALSLVTRYKYTRSGYYLTLSHPTLPIEQRTLAVPAVVGESGAIRCGFIAYLGHAELTLECHTWGEIDVPSDFRDFDVVISTSSVTDSGLR